MALDINGYNAAFKAFTDFATQSVEAGKSKAIARASADVQTGPLAGRTITASTTDSVRGMFKWFRKADDQTANNATRTIFKNAIADMFGGEDHIPDSVKDAMKMADFDKGKPLTARRILAVKQAIDNYNTKPVSINTAKAKSMVADASTSLGPTGRIDEDNAKTCATLLKRYGNGLPEKSAQVLANFIVNTAAHGELDEDMIRNVAGDMKSWQEFDFGDVRQTQLGEKIAQRQNNYLAETLPNKSLYMPDHPDVFKQLVGDANRGEWTFNGETFPAGTSEDKILDKFLETVTNPNARKVISSVLHQGSLADLQSIAVHGEALIGDANARDMQTEALYNFPGADMFVFRDMNRDGIAIATDLNLKFALDVSEDGKTATVTVTSEKNLNANGTKYNDYNIGTASFSQRITIDLTKEMPDVTNVTFAQTISPGTINHDTEPTHWVDKSMLRANVIDKTVEGGGQGAQVMKNILQSKIGDAQDPAKQLRTRMGANANAMMNWSLCAEMKKNGVGTQFEKDIYRGCNATLTDGKTTIKLTQNFETARDELAQFVTGDPKATYDGLAKPEDKAKVHLLMSLISQETEKAGENGISYSLDKREADDSFTMGGFSKQERAKGIGADAVRAYTIEKRADGGIDLHYTMDKPIKDIDDGTTNGDGYKLGAGSKFTCKMDYTLDGKEFNRLAGLDYSKFDDSEGYQVFNRKVDMPDGSRQFRENKLEKVVDTFAQEFKVNADCRMDFSMKLNPAEDE